MTKVDEASVQDSLDRNIVVSEGERRENLLSPESGRLGSTLLYYRGYVIFKNAVPLDLVAELRGEFDKVYAECKASLPGDGGWPLVSRTSRTVFWERASRFRIFPKLSGPFGSADLLANAFAMPIVRDVLGRGFYCKSVSSDTCVNGAILQSPHRDIEFYHGTDPYGCIVNIPLSHCGLHNGPLEVWPGGSHLWGERLFVRHGIEPNVQDGRNPAIEEFAEYVPSKKIELWPGDLLIRDPGMWHRGTPNPTEEPRTMLTLSYFRGGYLYDYGDPRYNIDEELYAALAPSAQQMFAYCFEKTSPMYWKVWAHSAFSRLEQRPLIGAPVRAGVRVAWQVRAHREERLRVKSAS